MPLKGVLRAEMKTTNEILVELQQLYPKLAEVPGTPVYRVPEGYFETLSDRILAGIKEQDVQQEFTEEASAYPMLASLKDKATYQAPAGYFEQVNDKVSLRVQEDAPAKVISIGHRRWWRYAAAAVVAIAITVASFQIFNGGESTTPLTAGVENNQLPKAVQESLKYKSPEAFREGVASLNDDEIVGYLEDYGSILDNDLLIRNTEVHEMPDVFDYLINENTLEDYLQKINYPG